MRRFPAPIRRITMRSLANPSHGKHSNGTASFSYAFLLSASLSRVCGRGMGCIYPMSNLNGQKISSHATKINPPLCSAMRPWRAADCGVCRQFTPPPQTLTSTTVTTPRVGAICSLRIRKFACGAARTFIWGRITARQSPGRTKRPTFPPACLHPPPGMEAVIRACWILPQTPFAFSRWTIARKPCVGMPMCPYMPLLNHQAVMPCESRKK